MNWNWAFRPPLATALVIAAGNTTIGLGCHVLVPVIVVMVLSCMAPPASVPLTVRLPVPETRRTKKRIDGMVESTHSQGLFAMPLAGSSTAWLPVGLRRCASSPPTMFALLPHDHPDAPL